MATSFPLKHDAGEKETEAAWIVRKLAGSMTGRIVMSSYESLRATGTTVICLSPWGDSSPLTLPCVRFRDLAVHTIVVATGGVAAVAAPAMGPVADGLTSAVGGSILVENVVDEGFQFAFKEGTKKALNHIIPIHSNRLETTGVKELTITLRFKHVHEDAALGFYRSSVHKDTSLFSNVKEYLAIEKGWFSPYLYASARRPVIPRSMKADIIFCHGPFLQGDYRIGETLLSESALVVSFSGPSAPIPTDDQPATTSDDDSKPEEDKEPGYRLRRLSAYFNRSRSPSPASGTGSSPPVAETRGGHLGVSSPFERVRTPSPGPEPGVSHNIGIQVADTPVAPPIPRRMVIVLVGLKPHRKLWTTSARPGESVIKYLLCNGCPAIIIPVKTGAPLIAWDCLTLEKLWELDLPQTDPLKEGGMDVAGKRLTSSKLQGVVDVIYEFLALCIDWDRVEVAPGINIQGGEQGKGLQGAVKDAIWMLLAAAVRTKDSRQVKDEIEEGRCGIAMWRIP